jgi:uncharacterized protein (TIGR00255 family)
MEGYGRGEASNGEIAVFVEIRASSHRSKEIQIRLPQAYLPLERRIKKRIADKVHRGKLDIFIKRNGIRGQQVLQYDEELALEIHHRMTELADTLGQPSESVDLATIFQQPGVAQAIPKEPNAMQEWIIVSTAVDSALGELLQNRKIQGKEIRMELEPEIRAMQATRGHLSEHLDGIHQALMERFEKRLQRLLGGRFPVDRLSTEAALLVEKSDISEDLRRIEQHCIDLGLCLSDTSKGVGRKMELLTQELLRELNTISSKVIPAEASQQIIQLKVHLENIRDWVSSVE